MHRRFSDHDALLQMYKYLEEYEELLFIVNAPKAQDIRDLRQRISREHILDRILTVERT